MTRTELTARLLALPGEIAAAEAAANETALRLEGAQCRLQRCEDELLLNGALDGKNAEIRATQLRQHTHGAHLLLSQAEDALRQAKAAYHTALHEFYALRAAARLMAGSGDE